MSFPETPRVRYGRNTLVDVACRLKFPPILKIDSELPAAFQDRVRESFPLYHQARATMKLPESTPRELAQFFQADPAFAGPRTYEFGSANQDYVVGLTREVLSLRCQRYERWEDFRARLETPLGALVEVYKPSFLGHSCLRYRNVIRRSNLPEPDAPWSRWLGPSVRGPLGSPDVSDAVESSQTRTLFRLPDHVGYVDATYGLALEGPEKVFVVDAHVYTDDRLEPSDVLHRLDALHEQARRFFRWCISDELHDVLQPGPLALDRG